MAGTCDRLVADYDLVVECTDNFAQQVPAQRCRRAATASRAVFASIYQYEGQLQVYRPRADWPCLRCLWPEAPRDGSWATARQAGVLGPVPGAARRDAGHAGLKILLGAADADSRRCTYSTCRHAAGARVKDAAQPGCDHDRRDRRAAGNADTRRLELEFETLADARASGLELSTSARAGSVTRTTRVTDRAAPAVERVHAGRRRHWPRGPAVT